MREKIQPLLDRRSIRSYLAEQITEEELNIILEAGKNAPSGMGSYKWKFAVIQKDHGMNKLLKALEMEMGLAESLFYYAPTLIIVFVDQNSPTPVPDGSLAIGNILNAATMIGLGSCWINCIPELFKTVSGKALQNEYDIPSNYICIGSCAIGYKKGDIPQPRIDKGDIIVRMK